jgi:hypothetical protein
VPADPIAGPGAPQAAPDAGRTVTVQPHPRGLHAAHRPLQPPA